MMNILRRIWTGIVAAVAGASLALVLQIVGMMTIRLSIDYLQWILLVGVCLGFLLGVIIGPRSLNSRQNK